MPRRITPDDSPRVIAIGDIHGCATALRTLLDGIKIQSADWIICLGDAIDRGPDSHGVILQLLELQSCCRFTGILGNHEQMLLEARTGQMPIQEWLVHGGAETLDSYGKNFGVSAVDQRHIDFLETWGDYAETPGHFFAHGNYIASRPLVDQPWDELRWQSLNWHTPSVHCSGKTAVLGHTSQKNGEILNLGHLVCIDTYCCGGHWLTALDVTTGAVWQANEAGQFRRAELPAIRRAATVAD